MRKHRGAGAALVVASLLWLPMAGPGSVLAADSIPPEGRRPPYENDYVIGVEDLIEISVWKNPDLSKIVPVRPDGKISLPLIDDVQAAGLTPTMLKAELTRRWSSFLSSPEVSVIVKEINSFKVFLVGEITRPGELKLKAPTRLLQAISLAGGFTSFADKDKLVVFRVQGAQELRFEINLKKVVSGDRPEDNLVLHPGDTIFVP